MALEKLKARLTEAKRLRRQAVDNASKQFRREQINKPVRVSSQFWRQVARDYDQVIFTLEIEIKNQHV